MATSVLNNDLLTGNVLVPASMKYVSTCLGMVAEKMAWPCLHRVFFGTMGLHFSKYQKIESCWRFFPIFFTNHKLGVSFGNTQRSSALNKVLLYNSLPPET